MSDSGARRVRHVGSIVDPTVAETFSRRQDEAAPSSAISNGVPEPSSAAHAESPIPPPPPTAIVGTEPSAPDDATTSLDPNGHPVRDRLLARAAAARSEAPASAAPPREPRAPTPPPLPPHTAPSANRNPLDAELDEIVGPETPGPAGQAKRPGLSLSPNATLLLAGLVGATALASIFALVIQLTPAEGVAELPLPTSVPNATTSASTPLEQAKAPPPPPRKKMPGPWRIESAGASEKVIRGNMGSDPFLRAIQNAGLSKAEAYRVYAALKEAKNLDRCRPMDEFVALVDASSGRVKAFEYIVSRAEIYQAREKDGKLQGAQLDLKQTRGRVQGALVMTSSSFADAARAAHFDPGLGRVINEALEGHTSVEAFEVGDRLRVVAQEMTLLGDFYRYTGIEAMEYLPKDGEPLRIYYHPGRKRYYDAKGRSPGEGGFRRPCKGAPITSKFNPKRLHPILKKRMPHNGTDFGAPTGTPIGASAPGEIVKLGNYGPNGNFIAVQHYGGYETGYSHLSRFEPGLKVGDKVKRMQVIGYVGSTGRSTGPHLHFSAKKNGQFIDPESLQLDALTVLAKAERERFAPLREKYDHMLDAVALPPLPAQAVSPSALSAAVSRGATANGTTQVASPAALSPAALSPADVQEGVPHGATTPVATPQPPPPPAGVRPASNATRATGVSAPPPQPAAPPSPGSLLYLSDEELIHTQGATDDGEVDE